MFFRTGFTVLFFVALIFFAEPIMAMSSVPTSLVTVVCAALAVAAPMRLDDDALVTEVQAAQFLNLSVRTLQSWRVSGSKNPFVRCGRAVRYRVSDLHTWIQALRGQPPCCR
jgi:ABC-type protease/lipase transport system fused ATPase/permease subunit